jgi:hypothetical protein
MAELIQTIPKNSVLDPSQDYEFLRQKGLEHIQQLGSRIWTDYNYHDPGITLMELLSYAITDLGYRTGFEMKDLLAPEDGNLDVFKNCFHKAAAILPCNQVTLFDLRKVLIDIEGVRNAWIRINKEFESTYFVDFKNSVLTQSDPNTPAYLNILAMEVKNLQGLYDIVVEFDRNVIKINDTTGEDEVMNQVRKEVHRVRNLCEDYLSLQCDPINGNQHVKKPDGKEEIKLHANIDIQPDADVEMVLAETLFRVEQFLAPHVGFYSMQELFDKGRTSDQIFDGPLLNHGFIDTEELSKIQKFEFIRTSDIYNIVMDIPGVTAVRNLGVSRSVDADLCDTYGPTPIESWSLPLHNTVNTNKLDLELMLNTYTVNPDPLSGVDKINFFKGLHEIPINPLDIDYNDVQSKLDALRISERKKKLKLDEETFDLDIPEGEFRELADYYPVQNELPLTYGTGLAGLPLNSTSERQAQAKQLKAYLLFFEQLLANYLSQLLNVREFFSWDDKVDKTYYTQILKEIKDLDELYVETYNDEDLGTVNLVLTGDLQEDILAAAIQKDAEGPELFYDRRSRLLNHLFARFNELFTEYTIMMTGIGQRDRTIPDKAHFLADYDVISHDRGKAFDYKKITLIDQGGPNDWHPDVWDTENVSGYKRRVCRFLGINNHKRRYLFTGHDFSIESTWTTSEEFYFSLLVPNGDKIIQVKEIATHTDHVAALTAFETFIANFGLFVYDPEDVGSDYYFEVEYPIGTAWARSQNYANSTDRNNAMTAFGNYFLAADIMTSTGNVGRKDKAEDGLHIIEHILLRPKETALALSLLKVGVKPTDTELVSQYENVTLVDKNIDPSFGATAIGRSIYERPLSGPDQLLYTIQSPNYLSLFTSLKIFAKDFAQYQLSQVGSNYIFKIVNDANVPLGVSASFASSALRDAAVLKFLAFFNINVGNYQNIQLVDKKIDLSFGPSAIGSSIYDRPLSGPDKLLYTIQSPTHVDELIDLKFFAKDYDQYQLSTTSGGKFIFTIVDDSSVALGTSSEFNTRVERDEVVLRFLAFYSTDKENAIGTCKSVVDPYSFRATVVLPAWTTRAQEFSYRNYAEKIIRQEAPAHVHMNIFWLDREQMKQLEICYKKFLLENAKGIPNEATLAPQVEADIVAHTNCVVNKLNSLTDAYASIYDIKTFVNEDVFHEDPTALGHLFADVTDPAPPATIVKATIIGGDPLPPFIDIEETAGHLVSIVGYDFSPNTPTFNVGDIVFVRPFSDLNLESIYPGEWTIFVETINSNEQITCHEITIKIIPDSEAVWFIEEPKHAHCYETGEVLAYPTDDNSTIVSASFVSGDPLPSWLTLNLVNGEITVNDADALNADVDSEGESLSFSFVVYTEDSTGGETQTKITIDIPYDESFTINLRSNCKHIDQYTEFTTGNPHPGDYDIIEITDTDGITNVIVIDTPSTWSLAELQAIGIDLLDDPNAPIGEVNGIHWYFTVVDHATLKAFINGPLNEDNDPTTPVIIPLEIEVEDDCGWKESWNLDICIHPDVEAEVVVIPPTHINSFVNGTTVATFSDVDNGINTIAAVPDNTVLSNVGLSITYQSGQAFIKVANQFLFEAAGNTGGAFTPTTIGTRAGYTYTFNVNTTDNYGGTSTLPVPLQIYKDREALYIYTFPSGTSHLAYLNYNVPQEFETLELVEGGETFVAKMSSSSSIPGPLTPLSSPPLFDSNNPHVATASDPDGPIVSAIELVDPPVAFPGDSFYKTASSSSATAAPPIPVFDKPLADWGAVINPISGTISVALNSNEMKNRFIAKGVGKHYHRIQTTDIYGGKTIHELEIHIEKDLPAIYVPQGTYPRSVGAYTFGDIIKYPTDPSGPVVKATLISGTLPPGTVFDTANGQIRVVPAPIILVAEPAPSTEVTFTFGDVTGVAKSETFSETSAAKVVGPLTSTTAATTAVAKPPLVPGEWNLVISTIDIYGGVTSNIAVNIKILPNLTVGTVTAIKGTGTFTLSLPKTYSGIFPAPKKTTGSSSS